MSFGDFLDWEERQELRPTFPTGRLLRARPNKPRANGIDAKQLGLVRPVAGWKCQN